MLVSESNAVGLSCLTALICAVSGAFAQSRYINKIYCYFKAIEHSLPFSVPQEFQKYAPQGTPFVHRLKTRKELTLFLRNVGGIVSEYPDIIAIYRKYRVAYCITFLPITIIAVAGITIVILLATGVLNMAAVDV